MSNTQKLQTAFDQVSSFANADEIAGFLNNAGVKGDRSEPESCPMAIYFQNHFDGEDDILLVVDDSVKTYHWRPVAGQEALFVNVLLELTPAMRQFIRLFDYGFYGELVRLYDYEDDYCEEDEEGLL